MLEYFYVLFLKINHRRSLTWHQCYVLNLSIMSIGSHVHSQKTLFIFLCAVEASAFTQTGWSLSIHSCSGLSVFSCMLCCIKMVEGGWLMYSDPVLLPFLSPKQISLIFWNVVGNHNHSWERNSPEHVRWVKQSPPAIAELSSPGNLNQQAKGCLY